MDLWEIAGQTRNDGMSWADEIAGQAP